MSAQFLPFGPANGTPTKSQARFQARILPQAAARPFTPANPAPPTDPAHTCTSEPRVNIRRDGELITHIEVHCACGRHLEIECVY